jgi:hypothetical protein
MAGTIGFYLCTNKDVRTACRRQNRPLRDASSALAPPLHTYSAFPVASVQLILRACEGAWHFRRTCGLTTTVRKQKDNIAPAL